jgi:hypothetical protein
MSNYNVRLSSSFKNVRLSSTSTKSKVRVLSGINMARKLEELLDVDVSNVEDKYVIMYDKNLDKYVAVNPDEVLTAATTEPIQPGLPNPFIDKLDVDLDNRIDLDGGVF